MSVEGQGPRLLETDRHPDGELGLVSGDAPGLRHRHDVAPGVQRVTVPTWGRDEGIRSKGLSLKVCTKS